MYTLLPEQKVNHIKTEYRIRLIAVLALFVGMSILVGAVALLPSYILSNAQANQILEDVVTLRKQHSGSVSNQNEKTVEATQALVSALHSHQDVTPLSGVVEAIIKHQNSAVTLSSFQIARGASTTVSVHLAGLATNREALVSFKNALEVDPRVARVELPISSLARSKDIHFSLTVYLNQ